MPQTCSVASIVYINYCTDSYEIIYTFELLEPSQTIKSDTDLHATVMRFVT